MSSHGRGLICRYASPARTRSAARSDESARSFRCSFHERSADVASKNAVASATFVVRGIRATLPGFSGEPLFAGVNCDSAPAEPKMRNVAAKRSAITICPARPS
jgi:hypothetical protein